MKNIIINLIVGFKKEVNMKDIKAIIAKNITELRTQAEMTQTDLAEKLQYSDKAVSKWERGESLPDISVLLEIAEIFEVSLDYLVKEDHPKKKKKKKPIYNNPVIAGISMVAVWLFALLSFVVMALSERDFPFAWLSFIYAIPISAIVLLIFNSIWFNKRTNYIIISALMWSVLLGLHLSFLQFGINISLIYILGIPGQIIIFMWSMIRKRK
jgi:transcriptional regulator with XRE-family HTH domain